jgi:cytochrome c oxidase cbb3-type subunit 3
VGNASEGKSFFAAKCSGCHSAAGDLSKISARFPDPKRLQNAWLAGGATREEQADPDAAGPRTALVTVTQPSGETVTGKLLRIDDFLVSLEQPDGSKRTFRRSGSVPKVVVQDPLKGHRDLLAQYSNKDVHDITAYLVTLK